jgi:hypothetical protein
MCFESIRVRCRLSEVVLYFEVEFRREIEREIRGDIVVCWYRGVCVGVVERKLARRVAKD